MFDDFELSMIDTGEAQIRVRHGGTGPPLLLLHGHPQTHLMWHKVAPRLAQDFTVVATDLRGYGGSSKPQTTPDHAPYSKRAMARDQVVVMQQLGFDQFYVAGHDRGARCAYRMALDHPERVQKLAVLDIVPTGDAFRRADMEFGLGFWHWFFLAQPYDLPERMIGANPDAYYKRWTDPPSYFAREAAEEYRRHVHDPRTIHAICEDYRAGATIDFQLDEADRGRLRIECPVLVLWSSEGELERWYDVLDVWRAWAVDVRGRGLPCGHYLPEEAPELVYRELDLFFSNRTWDGLPMSAEKPYGASVVVWTRSGEVMKFLLLHRGHWGRDYVGDWAWGPPGGARLPDEDLAECARRELLEETGLDLPIVPTDRGTYEWSVYSAEAPSEYVEIKLSPEHDRYRWASPSDAAEMCLPRMVAESLTAVVSGFGADHR